MFQWSFPSESSRCLFQTHRDAKPCILRQVTLLEKFTVLYLLYDVQSVGTVVSTLSTVVIKLLY